MHKAVLHIGSNIGDRKSYLSSCAEQLVLRVGKIVNASQIYETEAWGLRD